MHFFTDLYDEFYNQLTNQLQCMDLRLFFRKIANALKSKKVLLPLGILFLLIVVIIGLGLQKRASFLSKAISQAQVKLKDDFDLNLSINKQGFSGLFTVALSGIEVHESGKGSFMEVGSLEVRVIPLPLLLGKVKFGEVKLHDANLSFTKKDSVSNYSFIRKSSSGSSQDATVFDKEEIENRNLAKITERLVNSVLYKIPEDMDVRNLRVLFQDDSSKQELEIPQLKVEGGALQARVILNKEEAFWHLNGMLQPNRKRMSFKMYAEHGPVSLPLLEDKLGLKLSFDTLEASLVGMKWKSKEELAIEGAIRIQNLSFKHWRLAADELQFPELSLESKGIVGRKEVALDEGTLVKLGDAKILPYIKIGLQSPKTYAVNLEIPMQPAQGLVDAFPSGLFTTLEGMQVKGNLGYSLDLFLDGAQPDSVKLNSSVTTEGFSVQKWGSEDFRRINGSFIYTPYEEGVAQRSLVVGSNNPNFVPLEQISPDLRNAVLTAEDPSFFSHRGFVLQAIQASIATNYKVKAFRRGGSTISMQLVKNVFLRRDKNLARKIEEILIVWLMEDNRLVSKQRMYEVYLNVIEWGRNVYGVSEAAQYYFDKSPSHLSLGESIYLASIVPNPKSGLFRFENTGHLKPYMISYFNMIGGLMARRGLIEPDSTSNYGFFDVQLKPALRREQQDPDSLRAQEQLDLELEIQQVNKMLEELGEE